MFNALFHDKEGDKRFYSVIARSRTEGLYDIGCQYEGNHNMSRCPVCQYFITADSVHSVTLAYINSIAVLYIVNS